MSIFRQFKRKKNGVDEVVDLGALAQNITEDSTHRFVSDTEKQNWNSKLDTAGDIANTKVSFGQAASRANINSNETVATIAGKIKKWYADFKAVVWSGSYNDLVNKPTLGAAASQGLANNLTTTAAGYAMDARQGPVIQEKFNQINSDLAALPRIEYGTTVFTPSGTGSAVMSKTVEFSTPFSSPPVAFVCLNNTFYPTPNSVAIANISSDAINISYQTTDAAGARPGHIVSWVAIGI